MLTPEDTLLADRRSIDGKAESWNAESFQSRQHKVNNKTTGHSLFSDLFRTRYSSNIRETVYIKERQIQW